MMVIFRVFSLDPGMFSLSTLQSRGLGYVIIKSHKGAVIMLPVLSQ